MLKLLWALYIYKQLKQRHVVTTDDDTGVRSFFRPTFVFVPLETWQSESEECASARLFILFIVDSSYNPIIEAEYSIHLSCFGSEIESVLSFLREGTPHQHPVLLNLWLMWIYTYTLWSKKWHDELPIPGVSWGFLCGLTSHAHSFSPLSSSEDPWIWRNGIFLSSSANRSKPHANSQQMIECIPQFHSYTNLGPPHGA